MRPPHRSRSGTTALLRIAPPSRCRTATTSWCMRTKGVPSAFGPSLLSDWHLPRALWRESDLVANWHTQVLFASKLDSNRSVSRDLRRASLNRRIVDLLRDDPIGLPLLTIGSRRCPFVRQGRGPKRGLRIGGGRRTPVPDVSTT